MANLHGNRAHGCETRNASFFRFSINSSAVSFSSIPILGLIGVKQTTTNPDFAVKRMLNNTHTTRVGLEPTCTEHNELTVHRLNLSATLSKAFNLQDRGVLLATNTATTASLNNCMHVLRHAMCCHRNWRDQMWRDGPKFTEDRTIP